MGVPVLLVHGLRTSRTMWRPQLEALDRAGIEATAVDLPGHGTRQGEPFTFDGAVETLRSAISRPTLVVGLSLGGFVAIAHAARHPDQVAGLVAAGCSTRPHAVLVAPWAAAAHLIQRLPDEGAALNAFAVRHTVPASGAQDLGEGGFALQATTAVLAQVRASATPLADLARVQSPVWLVNGRYDHFRGEERRYLAACRDGRLVVVPGATHLVSVVRPERFTRVLLEAHREVESVAEGAAS